MKVRARDRPPLSSRLHQLPRLLLDLADGLGDLVHVGLGAEERGLRSQTPCLAEPIVRRAVDPLEIIGDPLGRVDRLERRATEGCSSGTAPGRAGCSRRSRGFPRRAAPRGTSTRGRPSNRARIIAEHVEMIGIPRAAVVHARRRDARGPRGAARSGRLRSARGGAIAPPAA